MKSSTLCLIGNLMQRRILIIDETNKISVPIFIDDGKDFLQVWGIDSNGDKNIVVEKIPHGFKKPPFVVQAKVISEHAGRVEGFEKNMKTFER